MADAAGGRFEDGWPVRSFPSWRGQRNHPGLWWSSTSGRHIGYESWLERDHAMLLDFDQQVTGFASQPLWLFWQEGGKRRSHARRTGSPAVPTARGRWSTAVRRTGSSRGTRRHSRRRNGLAARSARPTRWPEPWSRPCRPTSGAWPAIAVPGMPGGAS
nr:TnsA-like heteromeric transposase endonuclease subunit [Streptomyces sp. CBMA123]